MPDRDFELDLPGWSASVDRLVTKAKQLNQQLHFTANEATLLVLFYDAGLKARRRAVPKLMMYAKACERVESRFWGAAIYAVDASAMNLEILGYIHKSTHKDDVPELPEQLGEARKLYSLTADGLEKLQHLRPPVLLRLKAWVAVMPPWLVVTGSIAGGIAAIWKIIELIFKTLILWAS
jgi:hypothetical protein